MTKTAKAVIMKLRFINMRIDTIYQAGQVCLLLILLFLPSCQAKKNETPVLPPLTSPLSQQHIGFGVINVSYTRVSSRPGEGGVSLGYLRRGSVVQIMERRKINENGKIESWLLVGEASKGWLAESLVDVYENEPKARTASEMMER